MVYTAEDPDVDEYDDIIVRYEATAGTETFTINITSSDNNKMIWPSIAYRNNIIHVVAEDDDSNQLDYTWCDATTPSDCDVLSNWATPITAAIGHSNVPKFAQIAIDEHDTAYVAYTDQANVGTTAFGCRICARAWPRRPSSAPTAAGSTAVAPSRPSRREMTPCSTPRSRARASSSTMTGTTWSWPTSGTLT